MIQRKEQNPNGLHAKYSIRKIVGWKKTAIDIPFGMRPITKPVDENAEYFVLRLDTGGKDINQIRSGRIAIHAYADAIEPFIPQLAKDLRERYPLLKEGGDG